MRREEVDIRFYLGLLRRWWWVLAVGVLVAGATAFLVSRSLTPIYVAQARVFVQSGRSFQPSANDFTVSQQLAQSYRDLITTRPVMQAVIDRLVLPYTPQTLSAKLAVNAPGSFIDIGVTDPDPELAATIANVTAEVFIDRFREQQLLELARLQSSLAQYGITQDPSIIAAQASMSSTLTVVESAEAPLMPFSPNTRLNVLLGILVGLVLAGGVVYVLERLDDTIKSPDDLKELTGLPTLGSVFRWPIADGATIPLIGDENQRTSLAESFKFLTASLEFSAAGAKEFKSLLLTSSSPSEGKTTAATNLALTLARQGKSVILVDADLRKPQLHRVFRSQNTMGLSNLLLGNGSLEQVLTPTPVPGLHVVTSGPMPPDPAQLLRLPRTRDAIAALESNCDIVIFDTPPMLAVADTLVIAGLVDGAIMVVDTMHISREAVIQAVEALQQTRVPILGAILNKIAPRGRGRYYYYYYHQYHYYSPAGDGDGASRSRRQKGWGAKLLDSLMLRGNGRSTRRRRRSRRSRSAATTPPAAVTGDTSTSGAKREDGAA
ncbi:MAG: polysaccharide biosynthesis tyrosine autokinase [Dehalococcoidia bacterium]|nr:polysaccharide biosynthesis tyrosine autokinase [Dehalococcoidia bacterium]